MTKTKFRIREMTEDDIGEVQFMHYGILPPGTSWIQDFHGYLSAKHVSGFVAENEEIAGYTLTAMSGTQVRIDYLLVLPQYQRNGIAVNLLNSVTERYKADGARSLFVNISADNEVALALARKYGFSLNRVKINNSNTRYLGSLEL